MRLRFLRFLSLAWIAGLVIPGALLAAPDAGKTLVIRNARVLTLSGEVIEKGTIIVRGERILAVGAGLKVPASAKVLDADGKTVTPGFLDVHSALGLSSGTSGSGRPTKRATDAFDPYSDDALTEALKNGVTAAYVSTRGPVGIHGLGAVVRLEPRGDGTFGKILVPDAALEVNMGSQLGAIARIGAFNGIQRQLEGALAYRESLETYKTDLEEYKKKLEERAKKKAKEKEQAKKKKPPQKGGGSAPAPPPKPGDPKAAAAPKKPAADTLKKPTQPRRSPQNEILLKAIDRKLPVRIEAHRSADILNALDLAKKFSLDLILVGATEAHLVVDELSDAEPRIILEHALRDELFRDDFYRRRLATNGAALGRAGISWYVGSGARSPAEARFVALSAQLAAASNGLEDFLPLLTREAAKLLRVDSEIGVIRPKMLADLVIWSGDPRDPGSRVETVIVGGKTAYTSEEEAEK